MVIPLLRLCHRGFRERYRNLLWLSQAYELLQVVRYPRG